MQENSVVMSGNGKIHRLVKKPQTNCYGTASGVVPSLLPHPVREEEEDEEEEKTVFDPFVKDIVDHLEFGCQRISTLNTHLDHVGK